MSYLLANRDALALDKLIVHVSSPSLVQVIGPLSHRHRQRETLVAAIAQLPGFSFGEYHDAEAFNIALQTAFGNSPDRATVLELTSRLRKASEVTQKDDGVTQKVSVNRGVEVMENRTVKNPVQLRPWRTFPEVEQPLGLYVLRLREARNGAGVEVALFDADGGAWQLAARKQVADYLSNALKSTGAGDSAQVIF